MEKRGGEDERESWAERDRRGGEREGGMKA